MKCTSCGHEISFSDKFCPECGAAREITAANIFAQDSKPAEAPEAPLYQTDEKKEKTKEPGFFGRNKVAIIAIIILLLVAAGVIVFVVLKERDKDDDDDSSARLSMIRELADDRAEEIEQEIEDKEEAEAASAYDFDYDFDILNMDIDDFNNFVQAISGGQIPDLSQYVTPEMQAALQDYAEIFAMLSDPSSYDMSNIQQYIEQIEQITYDMSGFDISGISQTDFDAYMEVFEEMEDIFGSDVDLSWVTEEDDEDDDDIDTVVTFTTEVETGEEG